VSDHLDPELLAGIALLDPSDPERIAAEAHCGSCSTCRASMEAARATLGDLDALAPAPVPLTRLEAWRDRLLHEQRRIARTRMLAALALVPLSALGFVALLAPRGDLAALGAPLAWGVIVAVSGSAALALHRGGPRLGGSVLTAAIAISVALAALDATGGGIGPGPKCLALELAAALLPAVFAIALCRRGTLARSPPGIATAAAAGAIGAQLALAVLCPDHDADHLLAFHVGGVVLAALLAGIAGRLAAPRSATHAAP
jgi:hypothetical protein